LKAVSPSLSATNVVRQQGNSFCDSDGPFFGLGASYFQGLHDTKYNRPRLDHNLAGHHGLRVEVTVFADAQYVMPSKAARQAHLDGILANIPSHEHQVMHLEVANEAWQNGFPGAQGVADLRAFAKYLADRTPVLVAITSNDDTSDQGIISLYRGSAADLATVHFSRYTRTAEGGWLPVRDSHRAGRLPGVPPVTSNEPIGPGSSVGAESDPIKLCSAAAFAYLASLPGYVFHSRAGIYGFEKWCPLGGGELRFEHSAGIDAFRHLRQILPPDLANWTRNLSVANFASGNAYSRITTKTGRLDHHAGAPYENRFTQIVVTERAHDLLMCGGNRPDEPNSGARTTFWNIRALKHNFPANRKPDKSPQINIIGLDKWPGEKAEMGAWIEQWPGETTFPPNLYEAQKVRRFLLSRN
jgi:hypothetical protein